MRKKNAHNTGHTVIRCISCLLLLAVFTPLRIIASGQGSWTLYPSFSGITEIEPAGGNVYVLASNSIFSYSPADGAIRTYDKTTVLSDIEARHITWSKPEKKLIIVYDNSNIDLMSADGSVLNVPDLYMKETTYSKTVNSIYIYDRYAYLSAAFGIVKLDVKEGSIADSYQLGFQVDYCYIEGGHIYAASSSEGLYRGSLKDNLLDKNSWSRVGDFTAQNTDRTNVYDSSTGCWWTVTEDGKLTYYKLDDNGNRTYMTEGVVPDGPSSNNFYRIYINSGRLYGVGGIWNQETDGNRPGEVHVWNGESWSEFDKVTAAQTGHSYVDLLCLDFDPADPEHVMAGAKSGLYEFQDGRFVNHYNIDNSPLESPFEDPNYAIVTSVKYDAAGNLWVLNTNVKGNSGIKCLQKDGKWTVFKHPELDGFDYYDTNKILMSKTNGKMWFVNNYYERTYLYAYDHANDIIEKYGPNIINQDGKNVGAYYIYSPAEDKDGNIWVGTNAGPLYMTPAAISSGSGVFTQHKVPRNDGTDYADYLLTGTDVRAIAADGGNRKWIGTNSAGVFLISSDNNTQISHFTTENSPLPSNIIQDIAIDGTTGRVFFATDKGLCSYMGSATEPNGEMTKDNVYAYPNPVKPGYTGPITVTGLSYNADVKIVTAAGTLVSSGRSTGGSYTWDGCDQSGKRVSSGVYMVETATENGEKGTVCKIAVIN